MSGVGTCLAEPGTAVREFRRGGMVYRRLGETDVYVSLLSFGSHTNPAYKRLVANGAVLNEAGQAQRDRQIAHALDLGVNMVDTYENMGQWEPMARLVRPRRDKVLVSICRQFPQFLGDNIDQAAKLYGHVDLYRIYVGEKTKVDDRALEDWDILRKAKETGKVRAIGIVTHGEDVLVSALQELEGLDYIMFPFNFIHARAAYSQFLPAATRKGIGLIAIKPLAAGSIAKLDPRARPGSKPENERVEVYESRFHPLLPAVVAELTKSLNRLPDETLCQAALRFIYSRPFITSAMPGMFDDYMVEENYQALKRYSEISREEVSALSAARNLAEFPGHRWLHPSYRWLEERWRA
jgi:aryl-alcohol dehydrogenase-like predicted oxidoreductase